MIATAMPQKPALGIRLAGTSAGPTRTQSVESMPRPPAHCHHAKQMHSHRQRGKLITTAMPDCPTDKIHILEIRSMTSSSKPAGVTVALAFFIASRSPVVRRRDGFRRALRSTAIANRAYAEVLIFRACVHG